MLPSMQYPPAARMMPSISCAVRGATALPLTKIIFLPVPDGGRHLARFGYRRGGIEH
jgi:hypothetical protein